MMKDNLVKGFRLLVGLALISYLVLILINGYKISTMPDYDYIFVLFAFLISIYVFIFGIINICLKRPKVTNVLFGIIVIFFSSYFIKDNPEKMLFLGDLLILVGVFFSITGFTNLLIPSECLKKMQDAKIEIIEV